MKSVSSPSKQSAAPYEAGGRTRQKARTRAALVAAARELLAEGVAPTVEQAAERAGISRTTSYRYFPDRRALIAATYPDIEAPSLVDGRAGDDPVERLRAVVERFTSAIVDHEPELRAQLRLSLEPRPPGDDALPFRQGRAIGWIEDALAPLRERMPPRELRRLVLAIRATTGIEALVWLTDVAGLSRDEAVDLMRASAQTLLEGAMRELESRRQGAGRDRRRQRG